MVLPARASKGIVLGMRLSRKDLFVSPQSPILHCYFSIPELDKEAWGLDILHHPLYFRPMNAFHHPLLIPQSLGRLEESQGTLILITLIMGRGILAGQSDSPIPAPFSSPSPPGAVSAGDQQHTQPAADGMAVMSQRTADSRIS